MLTYGPRQGPGEEKKKKPVEIRALSFAICAHGLPIRALNFKIRAHGLPNRALSFAIHVGRPG